jgi:hypothetical protein
MFNRLVCAPSSARPAIEHIIFGIVTEQARWGYGQVEEMMAGLAEYDIRGGREE